MDKTTILIKLQKEFSFYKNNKEYFLDIIKTYKTYDKCFKKIICDLKSDWEKVNIQWFVDYLKNSKNDFLTTLNTIILKFNNWQINIDIDKLRNMLNKYPELDDFFKKVFLNKSKISNDDIENITNDIDVINILILYAMLKGIYDEDIFEKEENIYNDDTFYTFNSFQQYMIEINKIPLLPKEEVLDIFYNIDILNKKLNNILSDEEKEKIVKKINQLKTKIIESNLRLVVKIAKKFSQNNEDLMDLIQEGNQGLMEAVDIFDYQKGYSFTTYAYYRIFKAIQKYINSSRKTIKIPINLNIQLSKINRVKNNLTERLEREPTISEIASETNLPEKKIKKMLSYPKVDTSLDAPLKNEEESQTPISSFISKSKNLEEEVFMKMLPQYINDLLPKYLKKKEEMVIRLRFGIQEIDQKNPLYEREHTLQEIGYILSLTRERVRQIEERALKKLRTNGAQSQLQGYGNQRSDILIKKESEIKNMIEEELKTKRELYIEKIQLLSEEDRTYVFLRYGKDLTEHNILDDKTTNRARQALLKVQRMINDPSYVPQYRKGGNKSKNGPVVKIVNGKRNIAYLNEKLNCSAEDIINLAFCLLTEENLDILYHYYGATLLNAVNELNMEESTYETLNSIYVILSEKLPNIKRPIYLKDVLKVSEKDIVILRETLSKKSVKYKYLSRIYGENLLQAEKKLDDLNAHDLKILLISLRDIAKQFKNNKLSNKQIDSAENNVHDIKEGNLLKDLLNATDEEMNFLKGLLKKDSIMYKTLQKIYGEDLDKSAATVVLSIQEKKWLQ